jgi:excisionase family DNA binding protein
MKHNPNQPMLLGFEPGTITRLPDGSVKIAPGKPIIDTEDTITAPEAAKILKCSVHTIYRYHEEGLIAALQVKRKARLRVSRADVMKLKQKDASEA